jgi:hypothetical protein
LLIRIKHGQVAVQALPDHASASVAASDPDQFILAMAGAPCTFTPTEFAP